MFHLAYETTPHRRDQNTTVVWILTPTPCGPHIMEFPCEIHGELVQFSLFRALGSHPVFTVLFTRVPGIGVGEPSHGMRNLDSIIPRASLYETPRSAVFLDNA